MKLLFLLGTLGAAIAASHPPTEESLTDIRKCCDLAVTLTLGPKYGIYCVNYGSLPQKPLLPKDHPDIKRLTERFCNLLYEINDIPEALRLISGAKELGVMAEYTAHLKTLAKKPGEIYAIKQRISRVVGADHQLVKNLQTRLDEIQSSTS